MTAGNYNLVIEQGATFRREMVWKDADGNPIDLTSYTAKMQIRKKAGAADPAIATLTTADGTIVLGGIAGTIILNLSNSVTTAITDSAGVYDLELTSGSGFVTRLLEGTFTLSKEVTK